jgi:hypothetical protein
MYDMSEFNANFVSHLKISEQYVQKQYEFKMSNFI